MISPLHMRELLYMRYALAVLFVSLRSTIALFGSTVAVLVAEPSALGALVLVDSP